MTRRHPGTRTRRGGALLLCVLWVLGFEIVPGVHVALHDVLAPHDHGVGHGARVRAPVESEHGEHGAHGEHGEHDGHHGHHAVHGHHHGAHHDAEHHRGLANPHAGNHGDHHDADHPDHQPGQDPDHGAGSLAHRGVAAMQSPPVLALPGLALVGPAPRPAAPIAAILSCQPQTVRQRGPPIA